MRQTHVFVFAVVLLAVLLSGCQETPLNEPEAREQAASTLFSLKKHGEYTLADHYLVQFSGSEEELARAVADAGGSVDRVHGAIKVAQVSGLTESGSALLASASGVEQVTRDIEVQWVPQVDVNLAVALPEGTLTHNDPTNASFFNHFQWNMRQVQAPAAWNAGYQGSPVVRVGILDTGISPTHIDLAGRYDLAASTSFVPTEPFVDDLHFHGTFVSGIVSTNNIGCAGVAPHVTLVGVKVLNQFGSGSFSWVIAGIMYAVDVAKVDIINMSLGAYFPKNAPGGGPLNAALANAVNYANTKGVLVICAAGNGATNLDKDKNFVHVPSQSGSATSVNATAPYNQMNFDNLAFYSDYGVSGVDVAAPGGNSPIAVIEDLVIGPAAPALFGGAPNFYFLSAGTSFAAPLAAGIAALVDSKYGGGLNGGQLCTRLERSADDLGKKGTDPIYGRGRVNAYRAVTQ